MPGTYRVTFAVGDSENLVQVVSTGETNATVFSPAAPPKAIVSGVLRDTLGRAVPDCRVSLDWDGADPRAPRPSARTDAAGRFRLAAVPGGRVTVTLDDPLFRADPVEVTAPADIAITVVPR